MWLAINFLDTIEQSEPINLLLSYSRYRLWFPVRIKDIPAEGIRLNLNDGKVVIYG